jgi:hypothetical protein
VILSAIWLPEVEFVELEKLFERAKLFPIEAEVSFSGPAMPSRAVMFTDLVN